MPIIPDEEERELEERQKINELAAEIEAIKARQSAMLAPAVPPSPVGKRTAYDNELAEQLERNRQGRLRAFEEAEKLRLAQLERDRPKQEKRDREVAALAARRHEANKKADEALAVAQSLTADIVKLMNRPL